MKRRENFISNSSSSSFILIGVESSSEEYELNREFIRKILTERRKQIGTN